MLLLGNKYRTLRESDERGRASRTPPARRHRLLELIDYAHEAAELLGDSRSGFDKGLDGYRISELIATVSLFTRWRQHPAWPHLVDTLASDTEGQHSVMLLAIASYLTDTGNGTGIVFRQGSGKISDIWTQPTLTERLNVEIKTPILFRGPRASLSVDEMRDTIERYVKKSASVQRGQLAPDQSGILAIGAFHLGQDALDLLCLAGQQVLDKQKDRKHHLACLTFSELSYTFINTADSSGNLQRQFMVSLRTRLVPHPGYKGKLVVREGMTPWSNWPPSAASS